MSRFTSWIPKGLIGLFLVLNLWWLQSDNLVRDGDEEGHVGAAELFLHDLNGGQFGTAVHRAFVADMGDYPSLYPATVGTWWWLAGGGQPDRLPVRGINLGFLVLTALAVYGMRGRMRASHAQIGAACVLFLPLPLGLSRHFMPETALAACVALAIAAAVRQRARPSTSNALVLGALLGAGMLTKQTFPLYVFAPLVFLFRPHRSLFWIVPGLLIALPWSWTNLIEQHDYLASSAGYQGDAQTIGHMLFYPAAIFHLGLGPIWSALLAAAIGIAWRGPHRKELSLGLVWLIGGVILLSLVPKKYARLLLPLLPAVGIILAAAIATRPRFGPYVLLGVMWTASASIIPEIKSGPSRFLEEFEPGQIQVWFRTPESRTLGFDAIRPLAAEHPGLQLLIEGGPELTSMQTTHAWPHHLGPWLRREGLDREVFTTPEDLQPGPYLHVNFEAANPNATVPLVDVPFSIQLKFP